jgi:hypothetical protein
MKTKKKKKKKNWYKHNINEYYNIIYLYIFFPINKKKIFLFKNITCFKIVYNFEKVIFSILIFYNN